MVIKPAELTPLTTLTLAWLATEANLPDGVFNVVTGSGIDVGTALAGHPDVDVVTFTGSTAVGRRVMAAAAVHGHRTQLELGGKAPFVVFDDADLDAAVHGAVAGSLINSGQDCTAATRAIVARNLYDDFVAGVAELMGKVVVGDPQDPDTDMGPLISVMHRDRVATMVADAPKQGGRIVAGGKVPDLPGSFFQPTLIAPTSRRTPRSTGTRSSARCWSRARTTATTMRCARPTTPTTGWPPRRGPVTSTGRSAPRGRSTPAACGSTTTSRSSARCRTAGSARPASARI